VNDSLIAPACGWHAHHEGILVLAKVFRNTAALVAACCTMFSHSVFATVPVIATVTYDSATYRLTLTGANLQDPKEPSKFPLRVFFGTSSAPLEVIAADNTHAVVQLPSPPVPGDYLISAYTNQKDIGEFWATIGAPGAAATSNALIPFSTGIILSGATVVSAAPILMGFGSHTVEVINGSGESTMPPEAGGFAIPIPFDGTIKNLRISADLLVASVVSINTLGLQYDFTVFRSPGSPGNGIDTLASPYVTTPLTSSLRFGFPNNVITAGTFRSATNINVGNLAVTAGDRIGIRVRTLASTDPSAADITQLSLSATLTYTPTAAAPPP
jgi:hypothetical protein